MCGLPEEGRKWFVKTGVSASTVFIAIGLPATIDTEDFSTEVMSHRAFDGMMPLLPVRRTGLPKDLL